MEHLIEPMTPRELQVLEMLCDGESNLDIGRRLNLGLPTVKYHVFNIFGKLGVQRRTQAVAVGIYLGLIAPDWLRPDHRTRYQLAIAGSNDDVDDGMPPIAALLVPNDPSEVDCRDEQSGQGPGRSVEYARCPFCSTNEIADTPAGNLPSP